MPRIKILTLLLTLAGYAHGQGGPLTESATGILEYHSSVKSHDPVEGSSGWTVDGVPVTDSRVIPAEELKKLEGRHVEVVYHIAKSDPGCGTWDFYPPDREPPIEQGPPGYNPYCEVRHGTTLIGYARFWRSGETYGRVLRIREVPKKQGMKGSR